MPAPFFFLDDDVGGATLDGAVLALALFGPGLDLAFGTGVVRPLEKRMGKSVVKKPTQDFTIVVLSKCQFVPESSRVSIEIKSMT